jgi:hypothetical protein
MENLYKSKGGTDSFNCVPVRLTLKDLRLEDELPDLKPVEGFFFGGQEIYPEDMIHFGFPLQMPEISLMRATWYTTIRGGNEKEKNMRFALASDVLLEFCTY